MCERRLAPAGAISGAPARPRRTRITPAHRIPSTVAVAVALVAVLLASTFPRTASAAHPMDGACEAIRDLAVDVAEAVTLGVVVVDLQTGERCTLNGDRPFRTASLYKIVVAAELYRQVAEGTLGLDDPLTIHPRHHIDDPPALRPEEQYTLTVGDAAQRMIAFSDNGSAFALRELLGETTVDSATRWLGMPATTLATAFITSPNDQAHLLDSIFHGRVVDQAASGEILALLRGQEIVDAIPRGLPGGVVVAHKTGTLEDYLHDAGIVYGPGGAFVLVVMTEYSDFELALRTIQDVAAAAYVPFSAADQPLLSPGDAFWSESRAGTTIPYVAPTEASTAGSPIGESDVGDSAAGIAAAGETTAEVIPTLVVGAAERTGSSLMDTLADPVVLGGALAVLFLAVALPTLALRPMLRSRVRRRASVRYGTQALEGAGALSQQSARLRADRSERGLVMRFGSRRDDDNRPNTLSPASHSVAEVAQQPVLPNKRLQRVAEHFRSQGELLSSMRDQFEEEMEPLHDLIVKQAQTMQSLLQNLEERLRPLNEYADGEEANLSALEERIQAGGLDHVARSFSQYVEEQRRRIEETREQIDRQRVPFLEYGDAQRDTVETALSRFDNDIEALEANLAEQRRVMVRMLDAMRSETFAAVKEYLDQRQEALSRLAETGSTDPAEIGRAVATLRKGMEDLAAKSDYVRALLQQAEIADRTLIDAAPSPRPLRDAPVAEAIPAETEADEEEASA